MKKTNFYILFIITQIVYLIMILITIPNVMVFTEGNKILDLIPTGYTYEYVQNLLYILGTEGTQVYLFPQLFLDFLYPGLFIFTYYFSLKFLGCKNKYLLFLPKLAGVFDYIENIFLFILLKGLYIGKIFITIMSSISIFKALFTTLTFITILYFIVKFMYIGIKNNH